MKRKNVSVRGRLVSHENIEKSILLIEALLGKIHFNLSSLGAA